MSSVAVVLFICGVAVEGANNLGLHSPLTRKQWKLSASGFAVESHTEMKVDRSLPVHLQAKMKTSVADSDDARRQRQLLPEENDLMSAMTNRTEYRFAQKGISRDSEEHICFKGYASAISGWCDGYERKYPAVGGQSEFFNRALFRQSNFTLQADDGIVNIWTEDGFVSDSQLGQAKAAACIINNCNDDPFFVPNGSFGSHSWLEEECASQGPLPFDWTCSNRVNVLVQECGFVNAFVSSSDALEQFPNHANSNSSTNNDIIFYMCAEYLSVNQNPINVANTFCHELDHVIQGGYGGAMQVVTEGGATYLESQVLGLPFRPLVYAYGFPDWNDLLGAHIYAAGGPTDRAARKFYQLHQALLAYLSQDGVLGIDLVHDIHSYRSFQWSPYGREIFQWFLGDGPWSDTFAGVPVTGNGSSPSEGAFFETLLNFRVAIACSCIAPGRRPSDPVYGFPEPNVEPFYDCSAFPTSFSAEGSSSEQNVSLNYGGASISRFVTPTDLTLKWGGSDKVRVKVVAVPTAQTAVTQVFTMDADTDEMWLEGSYEDVYVVMVNTDPQGELVTEKDLSLWTSGTWGCEGGGDCWTFAKNGSEYYPNMRLGLATGMVPLPSSAKFSLDISVDVEAETTAPPLGECPEYPLRGYDGVQVRAVTESGEVFVLAPPNNSAYPYVNGTVYALYDFYIGEKNGSSCVNTLGWAGSSQGWRRNVTFDLTALAGMTAALEVLFVSDSAEQGVGVFVDNIQIAAGDVVLFSNDGSNTTGDMVQSVYQDFSNHAGQVDEYSGVPYALDSQEGFAIDNGLFKGDVVATGVLTSAWTACDVLSTDSHSCLRKTWLGTSYSQVAGLDNSGTLDEVFVNDFFEVMVELKAPFTGSALRAISWGYQDKMHVDELRLNLRSGTPPYTILASASSTSDLPLDSGTHSFTFDYGENKVTFNQDETFFLSYQVVPSASANQTTSKKGSKEGAAGAKLFNFTSTEVPYHRMPLSRTRNDAPGHGILFTSNVSNMSGSLYTMGSTIDDAFDGRTIALRLEFGELAAAPTPNPDDPAKKKKLSGGAIAAIVLGVLAVAAGVAFLCKGKPQGIEHVALMENKK